MKKTCSVKKTTTYTSVMYDRAYAQANYLGLTFHEYVKHLIAQDITNGYTTKRLDDKTAQEVYKSMADYRRGKYKTIKSRADIDELFK